jgi:hypothetical protein
MTENKPEEVKKLLMNETIYVAEKTDYSFSAFTFIPRNRLEVFGTAENALGMEGETVRVGIYKLDRIVCIKKQVSVVQVKCE